MKKMIESVVLWAPQKFWDKILILVMSILGYFSPIKEISILLIGLFVADIGFGYWKSKKIDGLGFSPKIVWEKTGPRMLIVFVLLLATYMLDDYTGQKFVSTSKGVGWVFGALLIHSIGQNGYFITKWKALAIFGKFARNKFEKQTGIKLEEEDL